MSGKSGMTAKRIRHGVVAGTLGALVLWGGTAAAGDYPPSDTTATTVVASGFSDPAVDPATPSELAATGSSSDTTLKLAGGAVIAGAGLLVVAKMRRRPAAT